MSTPANLKTWLVLHLTWDVSGTTAYDASGNGNNGTLVNSPTVIRNNIQKGFSFNGSTNKIALPNPMPALWSNFTISFWIKYVDTTPRWLIRVWKSYNTGYNWWDLLVDTNTLNFRSAYLSTVDNSTWLNFFTSWTWHHIVATYNWSLFKWFLNWVEKVSLSRTWTISWIWDSNNWIGLPLWADVTNYYNWNIGNLRIYNRALTPDEIRQIYHSEFIK